MANLGGLEQLLAGITPTELKSRLISYTRAFAPNLRFGAPSENGVSPIRAENFNGALVPFVTSATSAMEVAVPHGLARVPHLLIPALRLDTVNATTPPLLVTRAADSTNVYLSSTTTNATTLVYVE